MAARNLARPRLGFTLLEMLVGVFIVLLLTAAAIPLMRPALEGRRQREAARALTTYMQTARVRAAELGRPVGVWLERDANQPHLSSTVYQCEVPEPWTGSTATARVLLNSHPSAPSVAGVQSKILTPILPGATFLAIGDWVLDLGWQGFVQSGDLVRVNGQMLRIVDTVDFLDALNQTASGSLPPPNDGVVDSWYVIPYQSYGNFPVVPFATGATFEVFRTPVKNSAPPLQLPAGMAIDLLASGATTRFRFPSPNVLPAWRTSEDSFYPLQDGVNGTSGVRYDDTGAVQPALSTAVENTPVVLLFTSQGALDRVFTYRADLSLPSAAFGWWGERNVDLVHLLLAQRDEIPLRTSLATASWPETLRRRGEAQISTSWRNQSNLWVTIQPASGRITIDPVAPIQPGFANQPVGGNVLEWMWGSLNESRNFARDGATLGGR